MSLIHWWPLNGDLKDRGTKCITLINNGATVNDSGKIGKCYRMDSFLYADNFTDLSSGDFSVAYWVKYLSYPAYNEYCFCVNGTTSTDLLLTLGICGNGTANTVGYLTVNTDTSTATLALNTWYHVCFVYKGTNGLLYLNGSLVKTYTGLSINRNVSYLTINGRNGYRPTTQSQSFLNDMRVYDHALSVKEVREISKGLMLHYTFEEEYVEGTTNLGNTSSNYSSCTNGQIFVNPGSWGGTTGTVTVYHSGGYNNYPYKIYHRTACGSGGFYYKTANDITIEAGKTYTVSVYMKCSQNVSNFSNYSFNINRGSDNNYITYGRSFSLTTEWQRFSFTFTATSQQAGSYGEMSIIYGNTSTTEDIDVYYSGFQVEEKDHATPYVNGTRSAGKVYDSSGFGHNGTVNDSAEIISNSKRGEHSLNLNGGGDITVALTNLDDLLTSKMTLVFWIYPITNIPQGTSSYLTLGKTNDENVPFNLENTRWFGYNANGSPNVISKALSLNTWHHVVYTFDNKVIKRYINGVFDSSDTATLASFKPADTLALGKRLGTNNRASCYYSDFKIYTTALSASDVLAEYQQKSAIDRNGNLFTGEFVEQAGTPKIANSVGQAIANEFVEGDTKTRIFSGYTELDYIESSGAQWIDCGVSIGNDFEFVLDQMSAFDSGNHYMAGSGTGGQMIGMLQNHMWSNVVVSAGAVTVDSNVRQVLSAKIKLLGSSGSDWRMTNYTKKLSDSGHSTYTTSYGSNNVYLFKVNGANPIESFRCYNFKIYNNNILVRDFVPAKRKKDNVIGLYDVINQKFYTNSGSGSFTAGAEKGELSIICANEVNEL